MVVQKPGYPLQSWDINEPHTITGIAQSIKEEADEFFETWEKIKHHLLKNVQIGEHISLIAVYLNTYAVCTLHKKVPTS